MKKILLSKWCIIVVFALIIVGGFMLRTLFLSRVLSWDELFSLQYARFSLEKIVTIPSEDVLYSIVLHWWMAVFGVGVLAVRSLSIFFSLGSIVMMYKVARRLFGVRTGLVSSLLISISTIHILLANDIRTYSLTIFLALCSLYFFWQVRRSGSLIHWLLYFLVTIALVHTHLQGWLLVVAENIFVIMYGRHFGRSRRAWFLVQAAIVLCFSPWFIRGIIPFLFTTHAASWASYLMDHTGRFMVVDILLNFILPVKLFAKYLIYSTIFCSAFFILFGAFFVNLFSRKRPVSQEKALLIILLFVPLVVFFVFPLPVPKYFIVASIPFYIIIAVALEEIPVSKYLKMAVFSLIVISPIFFIHPYMISSINQPRPTSISYVRQHEDGADLIIVHDFKQKVVFDYYYDGTKPIIGLFPKNNYFDLDREIALYNARLGSFLNENNIDILARITNGKERVIYYSTVGERKNSARADLPLAWFAQNNWQQVKREVLPWGIFFVYQRSTP